ncbi:E3 ubiquitin-protein ligase RNF43 [Larimichthys crocea]|uniref:Uncharacterized protein n=1 Tax=Larimichthys crocea TaxID=215358 RepID=A0ACD3R623_LARCR|nr:E3 ubiquitin-protein ligase RNF43 [Larimichthys crocea]
MTVPQRRLAGLWPWLLMAALQVVLGQPGLESERPALRAVIKVALLNHEPTGKPITLEGVFVGGSAGFAEGKLMQYHPLSLCNTSEDERQESDFITIVKLEHRTWQQTDKPSCHLVFSPVPLPLLDLDFKEEMVLEGIIWQELNVLFRTLIFQCEGLDRRGSPLKSGEVKEGGRRGEERGAESSVSSSSETSQGGGTQGNIWKKGDISAFESKCKKQQENTFPWDSAKGYF